MIYEKFKNLKTLVGQQILKDNDIVPIHPSLANGLPAGWTVDKNGKLQASPSITTYGGLSCVGTYDSYVATTIANYSHNLATWIGRYLPLGSADGSFITDSNVKPIKQTNRVKVESDATGIIGTTLISGVSGKKIQVIKVLIEVIDAGLTELYLWDNTNKCIVPFDNTGFYEINPYWCGAEGQGIGIKGTGNASTTACYIQLLYREVNV